MSLVYSAPIGLLPISAPPEGYEAFTSVAGIQDNQASGTVEGRGGADVAVTGLEDNQASGTAEGRGGADVAVTGLEDNDSFGVITIIFAPPNFYRLVRGSDGAGQYLVEVTAIQGGLSITSGGMGAAIMELPIMALPASGGVNINEITLRYADRFWVGSPTDTSFPNQDYEDRVSVPLSMDRRLPVLPEGARRVQRQVGFIELNNLDGALDSIVNNFAIDGRQVRVLYGPYMDDYSQFQAVAEMLGVKLEHSDDSVRLIVRDKTFPLSRALQENFYAGTGGKEGTSELTGKPKPLVYGEVSNITLTQTDPTNLVYQVHDGPIESVDAVYDRGLALALDTTVGTGGDCADYAALLAASIGSNKYATCLAEGFVRLESSPAGLVTADVKGDKTGGVYVNTLPDVALRIMQGKAALASNQVNVNTWNTLPAYKVGLYASSNEQITGEQAVDYLVGSIGASWGPSRAGVIRAYELSDVAGQIADLYLDGEDIIDLRPIETITPRWRQPVGYERNWTVQRGEDISSTVTDARKQFLKEEWRSVSSTDVDVRTRHGEAINPPPMNGALVDSADATAVAENMMTLHSADRFFYEVRLKRVGWLTDLSKLVHITYPRFGFSIGRTAIVVNLRENASDEETVLTVWL